MLETGKIVLEASEVTFGPNVTIAKVDRSPRLSNSSRYTIYETLFVTLRGSTPEFEVESETWLNEINSSRTLVPSQFIGRRRKLVKEFDQEIESVSLLHDSEEGKTRIEISLKH